MSEQLILKNLKKLTGKKTLSRLFENDYLPKKTFDSLVTLFAFSFSASENNDLPRWWCPQMPYDGLKALLTHPHCDRKNITEIYYAFKKWNVRSGQHTLDLIAKFQPAWIKDNFDQLVKEEFDQRVKEAEGVEFHDTLLQMELGSKEYLSDLLKKQRKYTYKRTNALLENLDEIINYIKENPGIALTSNDPKLRKLSTTTLGEDK